MGYVDCPKCRVVFQSTEETSVELEYNVAGFSHVLAEICPRCGQLIVFLVRDLEEFEKSRGPLADVWYETVYPKTTDFPSPDPEIPDEFGRIYTEAGSVLPHSPRASAALSRYCIQHILREVAHVDPKDLANEIAEAAKDPAMPAGLVEALHIVRKGGNLGAHPNKASETQEIIDVTPGEAAVLLSLVERLLDFYFVRPAVDLKFKEEFDQKYESKTT